MPDLRVITTTGADTLSPSALASVLLPQPRPARGPPEGSGAHPPGAHRAAPGGTLPAALW